MKMFISSLVNTDPNAIPRKSLRKEDLVEYLPMRVSHHRMQAYSQRNNMIFFLIGFKGYCDAADSS